ncbi:MAG: hypothetical protein EOO77_21880 [Oxalobacteraceae bacterium]|nr:MAG: hypothetical protein EOO77_21880 [Oxalobacteraceae bacterium]
MPGKILDLTVKQGVNFDYEFTFDDGNTPATPIDISERSYKSQMRIDFWSPVVGEFTFDVEDQSVEANKGRVQMRLTSDQTKVIPPGQYMYDVIQTLDDATKDELCSGTVTVVPSITR